MGKLPLLITVGFIGLSTIWYLLYASKRVNRASAAMHVVERVTDRELNTITLENELRDILLEREDVIEDRFDQLIKKCEIIDIKGPQPVGWQQRWALPAVCRDERFASLRSIIDE